jgi:hypothetical protein
MAPPEAAVRAFIIFDLASGRLGERLPTAGRSLPSAVFGLYRRLRKGAVVHRGLPNPSGAYAHTPFAGAELRRFPPWRGMTSRPRIKRNKVVACHLPGDLL